MGLIEGNSEEGHLASQARQPGPEDGSQDEPYERQDDHEGEHGLDPMGTGCGCGNRFSTVWTSIGVWGFSLEMGGEWA